MKLRYVGTSPVTFMDLGVEVLPGEEFSVPFEESAGYLTRVDLVEVADGGRSPSSKKSVSKKTPEPVEEPPADTVPQEPTDTVSEPVAD
jgi:hypothetical protein